MAPQILTILTVTLNSIAVGQLFAWTSVGIPYMLSDEFLPEVKFEDISLMPFVTPLIAGLFSPLFSILVDTLGRKPLIIASNIPFLISWILIAFSKSVPPLYLYGLCAGIGNAMVFTAVPPYIGEIAEPKVRGSWGNIFTLNMYVGQFLINVIGSYLTIQTSALISTAIPVISFIATIFIPESPYFLIMKNKEDEAKLSLETLRGRGNVEVELGQIKADIERQLSESGTWGDLFCIETNRKAFLITTGLRGIPYLTGMAVFMFYTQYIFQLAKGDFSKSTSSIIYTGCYVITSLFASFILDILGRRPALIISCVGSALALTIESVFFYCSEYANIDVSNFGWIPLTGMLLYVIFFFLGLGMAPILMLSELFSASIKGKALGVNMLVNSLILFATSLPFQFLVTNYGLFFPFLIFTVCTYLSTLFVYYCVPETKGKTLEEIQQMIMRNK